MSQTPVRSRDRLALSVVASAAISVGLPVTQADGAAATKPSTQPIRITVDAVGAGKAISTNLIGIFFEDINDAADGGLYAELVQNRSFEYTAADNASYQPLTSWRLAADAGSKATLDVARDQPLHPNNTNYAVLGLEAGAPVGAARVLNEGFGGMAIKAGESYDVSLFARRLEGTLQFGSVRLESAAGDVLAEAELPAPGEAWSQHKVQLTAKADAADARLALVARGGGRLAFDVVSLFPQKTFKGRPNGLRADLAQSVADLKPKFMRFPGGCVAHGNSLANMYRWKDTIGPIEQRKVKPNLWGYQQGYGLGYFEYFQYCEDIGAAPIPVVSAGVSCQFARGGQQAIPMSEMSAYVQEVLDLIEWANGPATSTWGAKRAEAGHPEPFNLKYVGVGNEDAITPAFRERFKLINDAVKAKHPEIVLIGTSGPFHSGEDFERGWAVSREMGLKMVDEHYYVPPAWLREHHDRYDKYDRSVPVYLGEYASHDVGRRRTLRAALAEAAFLTGVERNADVVRFASYAPLLGKLGRTRWDPNLIYFSNTKVVPTLSYEVQKLFGNNVGDRYLTTQVHQPVTPPERGAQLSLGTWNTQAEFDDVRVTSGGKAAFQDDFAGRGAGELLGQWRAGGDTWQGTPEGTYRQTGDAEPALTRIVPKLDRRDTVYSLRARKTGGAEGFLIGFAGVDDDNLYWWNIGGWGNTRHAVEKLAGDAKDAVGRDAPGSIETGRWYDIRIEVTGNRVRCLLDGKVVHQFEDAGFRASRPIFASAVRDTASGDLILKVVNAGPDVQPLHLELSGVSAGTATKILLAGDASAVNGPDEKSPLLPVISQIAADKSIAYDAPGNSFTVVRLRKSSSAE